jgi:hypothetical protein
MQRLAPALETCRSARSGGCAYRPWWHVPAGGVARLCQGVCVDEDLWNAYDGMGVSFQQHAADRACNAALRRSGHSAWTPRGSPEVSGLVTRASHSCPCVGNSMSKPCSSRSWGNAFPMRGCAGRTHNLSFRPHMAGSAMS